MTVTLEQARQWDAQDPLSRFRDQFHRPEGLGQGVIYLCGNSLGLQPRKTQEVVEAELEHWRRFAVEGHFRGDHPWFGYHEPLAGPMARVVGAQPEEVVVMNALTVNLHLMMVSFYRPQGARRKILIEASAFPSDRYAVDSQARLHGLDPEEVVVELHPRQGEATLRTEDIEGYLAQHGHEVALVMMGGVNYYTGQAFELERITAAAHAAGALAGFDLAHAAGNLALRLHDWGVDFAVWCTYKYLNSGPGGVAGCFVHQRHRLRPELVRLAGWWGNDPQTRFTMPERFSPQPGAAGWQLSNAPVLPMAALRASLSLFEEAGMAALRQRSERMSALLYTLLEGLPQDRLQIITPVDPGQRGCQISLRAPHNGRELFEALGQAGVVCDFREPDVIRAAPVPLYNTFEEVWRFATVIHQVTSGEGRA
jgi:kynureninase